MDVAAALTELEELSTQVTRAVVAEADGAVSGTMGVAGDRATALAAIGAELLTGARFAGGGDEISRVEVVLPTGGVFALRESGRTIVATTVPEPTAGLVVYDLRTVLDRIAGGAA